MIGNSRVFHFELKLVQRILKRTPLSSFDEILSKRYVTSNFRLNLFESFQVTHSGILTVPFIAKSTVLETLDNIQTDMFKKAKKELDDNVVRVETTDTNDAAWGEFCSALSKGKLIQAPYCNNPSCEDQIKELSSAGLDVEAGAPSMGAKGLCIPFAPKGELKETEKCCICPGCSAKPKAVTMFGRSY